ncbi:hypothetical protein GCM10020254_73650 [Streptomyces goshikiensis]
MDAGVRRVRDGVEAGHQLDGGVAEGGAGRDPAGDQGERRVEHLGLGHPLHEFHDGRVAEVRHRGLDQLARGDADVEGGADAGRGPVEQREALPGGRRLQDGLLAVGDVDQQAAHPAPGVDGAGQREEAHRPHLVAVGVSRGAQAHECADDRPALLGDGAQHALVLAAVGGDHDVLHPAAEVVGEGDPVHVGQYLVQVDVAQLLVEHDQADGAGLEERVEEGQVGLHPVELVGAAREAHDDAAAVGTDDGEDAETAVEDGAVAVQGGQAYPPVAQGPGALGEVLGGGGGAGGRAGEEGGRGPGQHRAGLVAEEALRAGAPVRDPVVLVDAEDGHGDVFEQGSRLGTDRAGIPVVRRPVRWHPSPLPRAAHALNSARRPGGRLPAPGGNDTRNWHGNSR